MSKHLYIDTSGHVASVFLFENNQIFSIRQNENQQDHSKLIHQHIDDVLKESGTLWNEISTICVLNGPGSYTGLRISLAVAKGIAYAHTIPLVLLNKLDLIAHSVESALPFVTVILARENEYFLGLYNENKIAVQNHSLVTNEEIEELIAKKSINVFTHSVGNKPESNHFLPINISENNILSYCNQEINAKNYADLFLSEPFYMKNVYINK